MARVLSSQSNKRIWYLAYLMVLTLLQYNNKVYVVNQVFGVENDDAEGKECVICMAEPRTTVLIPCRHLCLCADCAQALRQQTHKCPICRSGIPCVV